MNIELNEYLDIFDPLKKIYFPIRVISFTEKGIIAKFIKSNIDKEIQYYQINNYGFKKSYITDEMIINCGFVHKNGLEYYKENQIIIDCLIGKIELNPYPIYLDYESNYFGYKFLQDIGEYDVFKEILKNTEISTPSQDFKLEYSTTTKVEDLRDFTNFNNDQFDEVYLSTFY